MLIKLQNEYQLRERGERQRYGGYKERQCESGAGGRHSMLTWAASTPKAPKTRWDGKRRSV
jgi:hypothetical protein